ncbi:MAG: GAF domain-containing protein [Solirubrobacterales bacterium]
MDPFGGLAPRGLSAEEAEDLWRRSPLAVAERVVAQLLEDVRLEGRQVALICDDAGNLLWIDGDRAVLEGAREINLDRGALWSESAAGTNAMGTALALNHSIQVFSAEHFSTPVHGWTCSAAPIHDPETGRQIGVIDLSGELATAHPHSLALVSTAARLVEAELTTSRLRERAREAEARPSIGVALGFGDGALRLAMLGNDRALVRSGHRTIELSRRQSEVLALLALQPDGLSADQIALELYGDLGKPVTARAEISRLRAALGVDLGNRPYRLPVPLEADYFVVRALLDIGRIGDALSGYRGPLLPSSEAPAIIEAREALDYSLREALLRTADADLLHAWLNAPSGRDDLEACRCLISLLDTADPRRPTMLSRLRRLSGRR